MKRALGLARRGAGHVHPNPMVGAVIVAADGRVVAEGYHAACGGPHAEVVALAAAGDAARGATLYVTLEPCCHHGRTPPCADAIVAAGVARVVVATEDPNPLVAGGGMARLREAGIEVTVGESEAAARFLNRGHFLFHRMGRPLVSLKLAATLDGRIAAAGGDSKWITSLPARREAHRLRAEVDAVIVGRGTVERDDPELTVRHVRGRNPVRVVLDSAGRVPSTLRVFADGAARTVRVTCRPPSGPGADWWSLPPDEAGRPDIEALARRGAEEGWRHLLVEGGAAVATACLRRGIVDRIYLFTAPRVLGSNGSLAWAGDLGTPAVESAARFRIHAARRVGTDLLCVLEAATEALPKEAA